MKTISLIVAEDQINKYGIKEDEISLDALEKKIIAELGKKLLERSINLAELSSLDKITLEDINNEITKANSGD